MRRKSEGCRSGSPRAGGDRSCRREGPCPRLCRGKRVPFWSRPTPREPSRPCSGGLASGAHPARTAVQAGARRALGAYSQRANGYFFASLRGPIVVCTATHMQGGPYAYASHYALSGIRKLGVCTSLASPNASHSAARRTPPPSKINRKRQYIHVIIACVTVRWPCGCPVSYTHLTLPTKA